MRYYGERVQGRLRYATPKTGHSHCTEQGYDIPDLPGAQGKPDVRRVVIVDRGECTFVTKVRAPAGIQTAPPGGCLRRPL